MDLLIYSAGVVTIVPFLAATTVSFTVNFGVEFGRVLGRVCGRAVGNAVSGVVSLPFVMISRAIPRIGWRNGGGREYLHAPCHCDRHAQSLAICDDDFVLV